MNCWMMNEPTKQPILVVYITVSNRAQTDLYAPRFCDTFRRYPPGVGCDLIVCCQGGKGGLGVPANKAFDGLRAAFEFGKFSFFERENDPGWDVSAYNEIAAGPGKDYEMMVCLGESCHFHREGWLGRFADAWDRHGPGMYAVSGSHNPIGHLITSAFAIAPIFLTRYGPVRNHQERYGWEHGSKALWRRIAASKFPTMMVTWEGVWPPGQWRTPANILQRGSQENMLCWFNHSSRFRDEMDAKTRRHVAAMTDAPFR